MSKGKTIIDGLLYTESHEWVRIEDDVATIGISDFAQHALGDIVGVELPAEGDEFVEGDSFAMIDSVKSSTDVFSPVTGEIIEINDGLESEPEVMHNSPYVDGYLVKFRIEAPPEGLMTADEYRVFLESQE